MIQNGRLESCHQYVTILSLKSKRTSQPQPLTPLFYVGLRWSTELPSEEGPANFTPSYMLTAAPCKQKHLAREMSKPYFVDLRQLRTGLGRMNRWMLKIILDSEGIVRLIELKNHT